MRTANTTNKMPAILPSHVNTLSMADCLFSTSTLTGYGMESCTATVSVLVW